MARDLFTVDSFRLRKNSKRPISVDELVYLWGFRQTVEFPQ